ncbi:ABC transporter ATP-binding protein [Ancylobacter mangrovi]|uniref:ABC transporter ATP-binding protein n=1 Tax=Ancylobacter mangrovi TaxID=2972472 RepID=UPI0021625469|nr:ABC transporter ATP-binding protein [Ancylobacter mangrovi]MCS0504888.1 ABC transporter ATP-binding protein [Ancylobacter mangrovi]
MSTDTTSEATAGEIAVELRGVRKSYGGTAAVRDVSLTIRRGEIVTLLGPSGCGKTSLLNIIAGFVEPDAGVVIINGRSVANEPPHRRSLGMVFQNYALFPHMSVRENVAFGLRMRRAARAQIAAKVADALDLVQLSGMEGRKPHELSGGQRQRVALARALVIDPDVLLLDEPLSALDKNLRTQMQMEIKEIQRRINVTTICVTHDQGEALSMSDRIAVMAHGEIQQIARPTDLYRNPASDTVAAFVGDSNRLRATVRGVTHGVPDIHFGTGGAIIALGDRADRALEAGDPVDVFLRPESIRIHAVGAMPDETCPGVVRTVVFQGSHSDLIIDTEAFGPLLVRTSDIAHSAWQAGKSVNLSVDWTGARPFRAAPRA